MWESLRKGVEQFDAMSLRERLLILITAVVAVALPVLMYLIEPAQQEQTSLKTKLAKMESESALLVLELATLKANKKPDPNVALQAELEKLRLRSAALEAQLAERAARLVSPQEMLDLLETLLRKQQGLRLLALTKGEPVLFAMPKGAASAESGSSATALPSLYRHELTLVVEGGYFDFLGYLNALEALPKSFFWDELQYQVKGYPKAEIRLKVHTLSRDAGWLGV